MARSEATAAVDLAALAAARDALQPEMADLKDRISGLHAPQSVARNSRPLAFAASPETCVAYLYCWSRKLVYYAFVSACASFCQSHRDVGHRQWGPGT